MHNIVQSFGISLKAFLSCPFNALVLGQVIFRSDRVLHRVLPSNAERYMLTVWIDSPDMNTPEESTLRITKSQLDDWCVAHDAVLHQAPPVLLFQHLFLTFVTMFERIRQKTPNRKSGAFPLGDKSHLLPCLSFLLFPG